MHLNLRNSFLLFLCCFFASLGIYWGFFQSRSSQQDGIQENSGFGEGPLDSDHFQLSAAFLYARHCRQGVQCDWSKRLWHRVCQVTGSDEGDLCVEPVEMLSSSPGFRAEDLLREGLDRSDVDAMAVEYCRLRDRCHLALVSTRGYSHLPIILRMLSSDCRVIYVKELDIYKRGPKNLLKFAYGCLCDAPHDWLVHSRKVRKHLRARFTSPYPTTAILFESPSWEQAVACKRKIRKCLGLGSTILHVTDSHREANLLAQVVFHDESLALLNHGRVPIKALEQKILSLDQKVDGICEPDFCFYGSAPFEVYGLEQPSFEDDWRVLESGDGLGGDELIYDPQYYFYWKGYKFLRLDTSLSM